MVAGLARDRHVADGRLAAKHGAHQHVTRDCVDGDARLELSTSSTAGPCPPARSEPSATSPTLVMTSGCIQMVVDGSNRHVSPENSKGSRPGARPKRNPPQPGAFASANEGRGPGPSPAILVHAFTSGSWSHVSSRASPFKPPWRRTRPPRSQHLQRVDVGLTRLRLLQVASSDATAQLPPASLAA